MKDRISRAAAILTSPGFLIALAVLLVNDFYLKQAFGNLLTGKLSDFAGLAAFALFWSSFFPSRSGLIHIVTAVAFIFWKSPASEPLIQMVNSLDVLYVGRTIDYTDLVALAILPLSHSYLGRSTPRAITRVRPAFASVAVIVSVFAFTATSEKLGEAIYISEKASSAYGRR